MTEKSMNYQKFLQELNELPLETKRTFQMICLSYVRCTSNNLTEWWIAYRKAEPKISLPSVREVRGFLAELHEKGWVQYDKGKVQAVKGIIEFGCRSAFEEGVADAIMDVIRRKMPLPRGFHARFEIDRFVRELRFAIYKQDIKRADKLRKQILEMDPAWNEFPEEDILLDPFDADFFHAFPNDFKISLLDNKVSQNWLIMRPFNDEVLQYFIDHLEEFDLQQRVTCELAIIQGLMLNGRLNEDIIKQIDQKCGGLHPISKALVAISRGEYDKALEHYEAYARLAKKAGNIRIVFIPGSTGVYYPLLLLRQSDPAQRDLALRIIRKGVRESYFLNDLYKLLEVLALSLKGELSKGKQKLSGLVWELQYEIEFLFYGLVAYWTGTPFDAGIKYRLQVAYERSEGFPWHRLQFSAFLPFCFPEFEKQFQDEKERLIREIHQVPLVQMIEREEPWKHALRALIHLDEKSGGGAAQQRLVWLVNMRYRQIQPKLQKLNKSGRWSKGQNVSLKRLVARELNCITPEDDRVIACIEFVTDYYGPQYTLDFDRAIVALVDHPHVYSDDNPTQPLELHLEKPHLIVEKKADHYVMRFSHPMQNAGTLIFQNSDTSFRIVPIEPIHRKIAEMMEGKGRVRVPASAEAELKKAVGAVSRFVVVHSDIESMGEQFEQVESHARIHCRIEPLGDGMKFSLFVRPFGDKGPYFRPGRGSARVIHDIDGRRVMVVRDLEEEKKRAMEVWAAAEVWIGGDEAMDNWVLDDLEDCLEMLSALEELGDRIVIEWPEGKALQMTSSVSFENLALRVKKDRDWFSLTGDLKIDAQTKLKIQELLPLLDSAAGRFIQLDENRFLKLSEQLRRRLEEMKHFTQAGKSRVRFHPSAILALQGLFEQAGKVEVDSEWETHKKRIEQALQKRPEVPSTLQADLRPYQVEGFQWLYQLAEWGVGACLADDMGLGKTLQALALMLTRAQNGPMLVVAPASVTFNWVAEAQRFAPTLKMHTLDQNHREDTIRALGAFDVLVISYGLLVREHELLKDIDWEVVVLDEAQAIKNMTTKRSKVAMDLRAKFRMITTGTPIENHLGELWTLFRFLNPGLLGSWEEFNRRFATPIERHNDMPTKQRLRKLIQPFILRRRKADVLSELPPKTEITLLVDLSPEEAAFYEALRERTIQEMQQVEGGRGETLIKILALIMKLRRACCSPRLVAPDMDIASSKLKLFEEIILELKENNHKALVFSQFVDHLKLIREVVEKAGLSYQYLDGSTPVKEREKRVKAFQAGEGDLFLISLRAGGFGLNLTAADYVIHMDPWWNPAVEDQASDRAHRIGQEHPVTIYRLVTRGTIEEKILELHREKRELAEALLAEGDAVARMTPEELMNLILQK